MRKTGEPTSSTEAESVEGFLGRWSRRKREIRVDTGKTPTAQSDGDADELPVPSPVDALAGTESDTPPVPGDSAPVVDNAPLLTDADMPALDSLGDDDDYSGFMSTGVSEGLRNKALRRLFSSEQFNVLDGLNDYDDDFTYFEPLGDIITSDMRHRMEEKAKKAAQQLSDEGMQGEQSLADSDRTQLSAPTDETPRSIRDSQGDAQRTEQRTDQGTDEPNLHDDQAAAGPVDEPVVARIDEDACASDTAGPDSQDSQRRSEAHGVQANPRSNARDG